MRSVLINLPYKFSDATPVASMQMREVEHLPGGFYIAQKESKTLPKPYLPMRTINLVGVI